MAGVAAVLAKRQFFDNSGNPLAGGFVDVYLAGTTTRSNTWQDRDQTTLNTNPVQLDSAGWGTFYLDSALIYKFVITDGLGAAVKTEDNIVGSTGVAVLTAATRTAMAAMNASAGVPCFLRESGREGFWSPMTGNYTSEIALDTYQAKYVPGTGAYTSYTWVRQYTGPLKAKWGGCAEDGTTNDSARLVSMLELDDLELTRGATYGVSAPVTPETNRTLYLNGATVKMLSSFVTPSSGDGNGLNAVIGWSGKNNVKVLGPGTVDANKVGNTGVLADRKNGIMPKSCSDYLIEGVTIKNVSGYGRFAQGCDHGVTRRVNTINCSIHFEDMECLDSSVTDFTCTDGDADITVSSYLHPVFNTAGCKRITFDRGYVYGSGAVGLESTGDATRTMEEIRLLNVHIELTSNGNCVVVNGTAGHDSFYMGKCRLLSGGLATNLVDVRNGVLENCYFQGKTTAVQFSRCDLTLTNPQTVVAPNVNVSGFSIANANATGADSTSVVRVIGGKLSATVSGTGQHFPIAGDGVYITTATKLYTNGAEISPIRTFPATNNYTAVAWDQERTMVLNWEGANQSVIISQYSSLPVPIGARFFVANPTTNSGGSIKTISAGAGATISGGTSIAARGRAVVECTAASTFVVSGDVT